MKVYISGAISILDYSEAVANFQIIEDNLRQVGVTEIFNPMKEVDPNISYSEQMRICIENLKTCDVLIQQSNWKLSAGAQTEFIEALKAKLEIRCDRSGDYENIKGMIDGKFIPRTKVEAEERAGVFKEV